jgi:hypothetical protein
MKRLMLTFLALGSLVAMLAADISGKWKADFQTPDGTARSNTFTFKVDGEKVTGTVAGSQDETPIQDGKVNGDDVSFTAERPFGKFTYKGKVAGGEIKFKVDFGDNSFEMVAKRI